MVSSVKPQAPPLPLPIDPGSLANERFGFTLFVSICAHVLLILGVGYTVLDKLDAEPSLNITLAQYQSSEAPDEADFLAQENQQGSGSLDERAAPSTPIQSQFNADSIQEVSPFLPPQAPAITPQAILTVAASDPSPFIQQQDQAEEQLSDPDQLRGERQPEQLNQTLASLQAQLDSHRQEYAKRPRKYTISSASTKKSRDALYLDNWRKQIESIGNLNYPQQASEDKIYGNLRLLVALHPDGRVEEIRILSSSGHAVLDEAAINIVRLASPFEAFPPSMKQEIDILEIIRTWQFHSSDSFRSF